MKVFALGGYGKTAIPAVKLLVDSDLVSEIAVAGRNLERAEKTAEEIGKKAIAVQADGTDEQQLISLLSGYDIVMNAAYNDTVLPTIRACSQTGTHYCDVSWGEVLKPALLQLDSQAKNASITAIVATGVSPCISNLMGVHVARQLDEVEQLQIGRADIYNFQNGHELTPRQWREDPKESLTALQEFKPFIAWMFQKLQDNGSRIVRDYHNGQWTDVDPIKSGVEVPLLQGGSIIAYPYACTDDAWGSLPHDLSRVSPVEITFSPFPLQLHNLLREQALCILDGVLAAETATNTFYDAIERDPHRWLTLSDDFVTIPKMWVRAIGRKGGRAACCSCWFTTPMWDVGGYFLTSVALAAAMRKLLRGEVQERGVMTAEKAFEPLSFFSEVVSLIADSLPTTQMIGESIEWLE